MTTSWARSVPMRTLLPVAPSPPRWHPDRVPGSALINLRGSTFAGSTFGVSTFAGSAVGSDDVDSASSAASDGFERRRQLDRCTRLAEVVERLRHAAHQLLEIDGLSTTLPSSSDASAPDSRACSRRRRRSLSGALAQALPPIISSGDSAGCSCRPRRHQTIVPSSNATPTIARPAAER